MDSIITIPIAQVATALANAQAEITNPSKNRSVTVQPREGRSYSFEYATLDSILDLVRPVLAKHGLSIVQPLICDGGKPAMVRTMILHKSGEFLACEVPIHQDRPGNQALGSAMTYARRYGLLGMLALAADEDDDGNAADGNEVKEKKDKPAPIQQNKPPLDNVHSSIAGPAPGQDSKAAKVEHDSVALVIQDRLGIEKGNAEIAAIKKRNGAHWRKSLAEMKALADSLPAGAGGQ